jgi:hypothetical protein
VVRVKVDGPGQHRIRQLLIDDGVAFRVLYGSQCALEGVCCADTPQPTAAAITATPDMPISSRFVLTTVAKGSRGSSCWSRGTARTERSPANMLRNASADGFL